MTTSNDSGSVELLHQPAPGSEQQSQQILAGLKALHNGDFSVRLPVAAGVFGNIADTFNELAAAGERMNVDRYKLEVLANVSHDLRTPLNSILILGQLLSDNPQKNLTSKQVEFAQAIHRAGSDLLNLINDIVDLSKISSGTLTVDCEELPLVNLSEALNSMFRHEAAFRKLTFQTNFDPRLCRNIVTDPKRLLQVLKNLLANAFKITEQGGIRLDVFPATGGWSAAHPVLTTAPAVIAFEVCTTSTGVAEEKQRIIFEAFQQADAGAGRTYGGTGLAISRILGALLGGDICLRHVPGRGCTFTLYLPQKFVEPAPGKPIAQLPFLAAKSFRRSPEFQAEPIRDDRDTLQPVDAVLLIVEDDPHFARILLGLAREKGFKGVVAQRGSDVVSLARQTKPTAISLDIFLPDMLGWTVLSELKRDAATRHIPVQITTLEDQRQHGLEQGAFSYLLKPVAAEALLASLDRLKAFAAPRVKKLLVVNENEADRLSVVELLGHDDIAITTAGTAAEALDLMRASNFDCVVLDLRLADISGFEVLEKVQEDPKLREVPIVVFTAKDLTPDEETRLRMMAKRMVLKGVKSPERLLDETALFLHRVVTDLPPDKQEMLRRLQGTDAALVGRKVLVVDDDVRSVFAMSCVLERHGMAVVSAATGREAIKILESTPDVAITLMDIRMPEMDGYETMSIIRRKPNLRRHPIIAQTALAMKGEYEKCLQAGASDYIAKPVNTDQLLALLRVWLQP